MTTLQVVLLAVTVAVVAAFAVSWQLTRVLASGRWLVVLDHPNERSLHHAPTPRTGGIAIVSGLAAGHLAALAAIGLASASFAFTVPGAVAAAVTVAAVAVLAVSLFDDLRNVPVVVRLGVHVAAACVLVLAGPGAPRLELAGASFALPAPAAVALAVLGVVWLINLYNFMDGMDGFAGGMGVVGFAALAVLAARGGDPALAVSAVTVAAACAGFLVLNFPPARIFMGDAGSSVLGLLAGALALAADRAGAFPVWLALLVFSPFVVDATVTLLRRALRGETVWRAHRSHYYQRLVQLGWGHRRTTLAEYALMLSCAASAIALQHAPAWAQGAGLGAWAIVYVILMRHVSRLERAGAPGGSVPHS